MEAQEYVELGPKSTTVWKLELEVPVLLSSQFCPLTRKRYQIVPDVEVCALAVHLTSVPSGAGDGVEGDTVTEIEANPSTAALNTSRRKTDFAITMNVLKTPPLQGK